MSYKTVTIYQALQLESCISVNKTKKGKKKTASVRIPYRSGSPETIRKDLSDFNICAFFRTDNTLKRYLSKAKGQFGV